MLLKADKIQLDCSDNCFYWYGYKNEYFYDCLWSVCNKNIDNILKVKADDAKKGNLNEKSENYCNECANYYALDSITYNEYIDCSYSYCYKEIMEKFNSVGSKVSNFITSKNSLPLVHMSKNVQNYDINACLYYFNNEVLDFEYRYCKIHYIKLGNIQPKQVIVSENNESSYMLHVIVGVLMAVIGFCIYMIYIQYKNKSELITSTSSGNQIVYSLIL